MDSCLKWHGGKAYLAKKIVAMMPPHIHYVEPYAGGLSVLFAKDPEGHSEVVNDINGDLSTFWRVLQNVDTWRDFQRIMQAVPFSAVEYQDASKSQVFDTDVDRAVAFFIRCRQSMAGRMDSFAPLSRNRTRRGMNEQASAWLSAVDGLPAVHERLKRVVVLNADAVAVIRQQDGPNTLFYCDPPYLHETRTAPEVYEHEMSAIEHADLLDTLSRLKGKFLLSGYPSALYTRYAAIYNWKCVHFDLPNNSASGETKRRMTECIWSN